MLTNTDRMYVQAGIFTRVHTKFLSLIDLIMVLHFYGDKVFDKFYSDVPPPSCSFQQPFEHLFSLLT